ncbi:MAG: hypothetical protein Q9204_001450 [Flavoplaca sp. TL-2023a]
MANPSNLIRLVPLQLEDLPAHPALKLSLNQRRGRGMSRTSETRDQSMDPQKTSQTLDPPEPDALEANGRPHIQSFIKAILDDAVIFTDDTLPTKFEPHSNKSSTSAKTKIELLQRHVSAKELSKVNWQGSKIPRHVPDHVGSEAWFARRSRHVNEQAKGTANLDEFDFALRIDHCQHEAMYTPEVYDAHRVLDWKISEEMVRESDFADYQNITMSIFEMCHKLPFPLSKRVFSVLVITATTGREDFVVVQLPVEIGTLQEAFYSNGRNLTEGSTALKRKKPIMGKYMSIERCVLRPIANEIEWTMATTSDAMGWLPMWAQRIGIPGAIAHDVDFLMDWIREKRKAGALKG